MKSSSFLFAIFTTQFFFFSCEESSKEQINPGVDFQGLWESVDTAANLPFGTIQIESNKDSLFGSISYVFANSSAASKRVTSGQPFQGLISGESASITILGAQNQAVGNAEIAIVKDTLIYSVKATGIEFPKQRFVKSSAKASKSAIDLVNNDARWNAFRKRGIDFVATGNEPFWSVEIDMEGSIRFTSLNQPNFFEVPVPKPEYPAGKTIVRYFSKTDSGMIDVVIQNMPCTDNMSGVESPAFVTVKVKAGQEPALSAEGCGRFLGDARINGDWKLIRIGEKSLDKSQFSRGVPNLELDLDKGRFWGTGVCNKYSGAFEIGNGYLITEPVMSTKMACELIEIEELFFQILSDQELKYGFGGKELLLQSRNGRLIFERAADN